MNTFYFGFISEGVEKHKLLLKVLLIHLALIRQMTQIGESLDKPDQRVFGDTWPVLPQHGQLGLHAGVVDGVATKQVTEGSEEIIAQEWKAWAVGQHKHPEIRMHLDDVVIVKELWSRNNSPTIG